MNRIDHNSMEHVHQYLNPMERANYARTSRFHANKEKASNNQKCLLQTIGGLKCGGIIQGLSIGKECVNYCNLHTKTILTKVINLFFSKHLIAKMDYDESQIPVVNLDRSISIHGTLNNDDTFSIHKDEIYYDGDVYTLKEDDNIGEIAVDIIPFQTGWILFEFLIQQSRFDPDSFVIAALLLNFHDKEFNIKSYKTVDTMGNEEIHIKMEPWINTDTSN
jgi:hypothetical protein